REHDQPQRPLRPRRNPQEYLTACSALSFLSKLVRRRAAPELPAGEPCALDQAFELGPHDRFVHATDERALREPAVGAGNHPVAADDIREAHETFGDELRMLDDIGLMADDARHE